MINTDATDVLEAVATNLCTDWAQGARATVMIAEDPAHALDLMRAVKPGSTSVVLFYVADGAVDQDCPDDVLVDATIRAAIVQHPGLKLADGRRAPTVMQAFCAMRTHLGKAEFSDLAGGRLEYRGMSYLATEDGMMLHGYAATYSAIYAYTVE